MLTLPAAHPYVAGDDAPPDGAELLPALDDPPDDPPDLPFPEEPELTPKEMVLGSETSDGRRICWAGGGWDELPAADSLEHKTTLPATSGRPA